MANVFMDIELSGIANFIEHDAVMLRNDLVSYGVMHHPINRDNARMRIKALRDALTATEQKIEATEMYLQSIRS